MSYQTELAAVAIAIANSSFSNVSKLARLVAIYGDKKEVKVCWSDVCENNGLSSSTSKDYWTLAVSFGFMFTDYQATRELQVKQTEAKFSDLGITSLKTMKTYKICASKLLGFESSLKTMRSSNGQNNKLENLIKLVTDSKGKTLSTLESNLTEVDSYLKALADEAEKAAPVVEDAAPVVEDAAPVVEDAAPVVEDAAPVVEDAAPVVEDAAPVVEDAAPVVEDAAPVVEDTQTDFALARASILASLTTSELLDVIGTHDNDSLQAILKGVQAMIKARNKKAA